MRGDPKHGDPMRGDPQRYAPCGTRHGGGRISKHMSADRNVHTTRRGTMCRVLKHRKQTNRKRSTSTMIMNVATITKPSKSTSSAHLSRDSSAWSSAFLEFGPLRFDVKLRMLGHAPCTA